MEIEEHKALLTNPKLQGSRLKKHTAKDSVFGDLFSDKKYLLQLYQTLHPEDGETTEDDLTGFTIKNVLTNQAYNDLGFMKKDTLIILMEEQTTWTMNILPRILLYVAESYQRYFTERKFNLYSSKKIPLPQPEFYVIYTGDRQTKPEYIKLSEEFFEGKDTNLEIKVKILYGEDENNIIGQYVAFTKVYDEQRKKYAPEHIREAILETIQICKNRNLLKEYLENREKEVVSIMMTLFDEEEIQKIYIENERRDAAAAAAATAKAEGIHYLVKTCQDLLVSYPDTVKRVMDGYKLSEEKAKEYVTLYWR